MFSSLYQAYGVQRLDSMRAVGARTSTCSARRPFDHERAAQVPACRPGESGVAVAVPLPQHGPARRSRHGVLLGPPRRRAQRLRPGRPSASSRSGLAGVRGPFTALPRRSRASPAFRRGACQSSSFYGTSRWTGPRRLSRNPARSPVAWMPHRFRRHRASQVAIGKLTHPLQRACTCEVRSGIRRLAFIPAARAPHDYG